MRLRRFLLSLWICRRELRYPFLRHNVRALWCQSRPGWIGRQTIVYDDSMSDEEFDAFLEAIR